MGDDRATGVAFTRNPSTGENAFYGEFLINAQGEDVVAGIRTPQQLTLGARKRTRASFRPWRKRCRRFSASFDRFGVPETHYRDMQDIEFTVQQGRLWMLHPKR